jgi:predicted transcriptional regulator
MRKPLTIRLTPEGDKLLSALAEAQGTSKAAQVELAIRDRAKANGIAATPNASASPRAEAEE